MVIKSYEQTWCRAWLDQVQSILDTQLSSPIIDILTQNCKICLKYLCLTKSAVVLYDCWFQCGYVNKKENLDHPVIWHRHCTTLYKILLMLCPSTVDSTWQEMIFYHPYVLALKKLCREVTILHLKKIYDVSELDIRKLINILNTSNISYIDTLLELCKVYTTQDIQKILLLRANSRVLSYIMGHIP